MTTMISSTSSSSAMGAFWENVRTIVYALMLAMAIRFTIAQPFRIPSSSMVPTLEVGDYIVVTKWSFGYGRYSFAPLEGLLPHGRLFGHAPTRGQVVVFRPSPEPDRDFIKRVIGLPGDRIQMRNGRLFINGVLVPRESLGMVPHVDEDGETVPVQAYEETLPGGVRHMIYELSGDTGALDNTGVYTVPPDHYFMMGDNRDNSSDSRVQFGHMSAGSAQADDCAGFEDCYVPFDNLVGPAQFVITSFNSSTSIFRPWTLITGFRTDRFLKPVH
ncbi:MAG: signal peptidase I [Pseudomonadota bacterium]